MTDVIKDTLVAFCVPGSTELAESDVRDTCKKWLPPYMVPSDILILETMPYLASGKVDRRTLQKLHQEFRESQDPSPEIHLSPEIERLADLFKEVLKVDVSKLPNISTAGIDSLSSIRVASKLRESGYPNVSATDILEARTLTELHDRLDTSKDLVSKETSDASLLQRADIQSLLQSHEQLSKHMDKIQDIVACTPVQSAMLSETGRNPQSYCNWIELQVDLQRSMGDVEKAVQALISHHEMLRTGFAVLHDAQHPYASVIWRNDCVPKVITVAEVQYGYAIQDESQMLTPRAVQLRQSAQGTHILFQLHHSLYDQWSVDVMKEDLDQLLRGNELSSAQSYTELVSYHLQSHDTFSSGARTEFWQSHLQEAAVTPLPQLNGQKCAPNLQRSNWITLDVTTASLKRTATDTTTSAPAIFQAAYSFLLSLYAGTLDVMYGTVFSGRHVPVAGVERIVGPCLSTLPSRTDIDGVRTCRDLVQLVHNHNRGMLKHADTPLVEVKRIGNVAPNETMFDTLFVWQESTFAKPELVTEINSADQHELNLVLEVEPRSEHVAVRVTYQQSRINKPQVNIFVEQLRCLVQRLIDEPQLLVSDLAKSLPEGMMAIDNPHPATHTHQSGLIAALEDVAERMPSAPALVFAQSLGSPSEHVQSLTYSEMHTSANRLARHLMSSGVKADDLVCVCMDKSIDLYVAILAVLKAGAGYLPLLPDTPKNRLLSILDQTSPIVFLCDGSVPEDSRSVVETKVIDLSTTDVSNHSGENLALAYFGDHAAYSIFTSGSTGTPKGLIVTQDNLLGNLSTLANIYPVAPDSRLLQACSQAFDVSVFEIFFAFFTGMPLCFARKDDLFQDIERGIRSLGITHLSLTPTVAALVDPANVPSVCFLVTAGEPMTNFVHKKWAGKGLHQGYGPSETTNICTVNAQMPSSDIISNIGPAFPNTSAFVIDPHKPFEILPLGAVGEYAFGGEQVFRGYIGRDALNAEKIINHPVYGRVYRSGDIGRMLPGGTLLISGRLDDQVKVRGNRIELGEINASILLNSFVADCTTMVLGKDSNTQSIATFWIPATSSTEGLEALAPTTQLEQQVSELYLRLEASLPPYMVPTMLVPISRLPRTTQGKLDRRRLESIASTFDEDSKQAYYRAAGQGRGDDGAWTSMEQQLLTALETVIDLSPSEISRNTSFFALGLNSINAIAYAKAIENHLGTVVSMGSILKNASIALLSSSITSQVEPKQDATPDLSTVFSPATISSIETALAAESRHAKAILPCTPLQEAMLSAGDSHTDATYSNRTKFNVIGDVKKLVQCFQELAKRHAILRTRFFETSEPNHPFAQVVLDEADSSWLGQAHRHEVNGDVNVQSVSLEHPFSLNIETTGKDEYLVLHMHHAIYDGTSMSLLLEEAEMLYNEQLLPPAPTFEPFLKETQAHAGSSALSFWSSFVHNYSAKPFPLLPESEGQAAGGRVEISLANTQVDLEEFAKRKNVSAASVYQTAWAKVLAAAQAADDVCFGDVVSGRSVPVANVDKLVAPCFNTLPVRVSLDDAHDNIGLVRKLHKQRLSVDSYQLTPLRRIQVQSKTPSVHLFDSLLLVQPPARNLDRSIWELSEDEGLMDLPLVIEVVQNRTTPDLTVHYNGRYFTKATASLIANAFVSSLESCLRFPSSSIHDIDGVDKQSFSGMLATKLVTDDLRHSSEDENSAEVWSEEERLVQQAFSHFSSVQAEKIRRHTSLYRLGLDSLHAVQVASRLRSKGLTIAAADVMEYQTPAALAAAISTTPQSEDRPKVDLAKYDSERRSRLLKPLEIPTSVLESLRPCTPAQNGMISQSLESHGDLYVNHIVYEVPDEVTEDALRSAWRRLQHKHQALRMGFVQTDEAHCPFAMMIYNIDEVDLPITSGSSNQAGVSGGIIDTLHRPAWRLDIDLASRINRMTLSMHHALYDAESLQVLLQDLSLALQQKDLDAPLSIDNILDSMLTGANNVEPQAEQFWRKSLKGVAPSPFPNLNPVTTTASDLFAVQKTSDLSYASLESLCKTKGCTIQAAGQTAWALLLSAYLGEPTVTFGTVFSGRTNSHNDSIVFPSIATLPVFCDTANGNTKALRAMTDFNGTAQRHKYVPLSDIQRFANLPGQALFDTVFVYQKSNTRASDTLKWHLLEQSAAVDYNVSLELESTPTEISLVLTANRGIIPEEHSRLLLEQYDHLLKQILHNTTPSPFSHSDVYSNTPAKCPSLPSPVKLLHQFVEEGARNTPRRPALEFTWSLTSSPKSKRVWSYKELDERSNQVAHMVQANGAVPGGIVAVCMSKCPEASFAFIGILKAGCAFLALDPELPQARKDFILKDSGAALLLVDQMSNMNVDEMPSKVLPLVESDVDVFPTSAIEILPVDPQVTCYCLYTSGTTGTPKGCELTHENAVQAMMAFQKLFAGRWNEQSRWLQFASYWFDVSVLEQFWSWSVGITLVGAPRDLVLDDIALFIQQLQITHIDLTPSLARILDPEDVPSLWDGVFITGGEALKQEIIEKWGSHRTICNGYGPTEATIGVTMNPFIGPDAKSTNIGPAFLNVGSYVFEPGTTAPVLRGAIGELCVSGKLVGKGYLNRPELTAKAFPVLEGTGEKIYRTGDLVRQAADGSFLFIGRQDSQAKLRGQRLEIDEIDSVIKTSTGSIADLASLVIKGQDKETLVTFFITEVRRQTPDLLLDISEDSRTAARLALESCRSRLPGYMVPTHILPVNIIPLTVNNKIDSKRLTAFYNELSVSALQSIKGAPTSAKAMGLDAKKICETLERMLSIDVKAMDSSTNVFSLGISSVSAITFTTLLKRAGFPSASVATIMRNPEIGQLANALSGPEIDTQGSSSVRQAQMSMEAFGQRYRTLAAARLNLNYDDIDVVAPCTPLQQGLILESLRGEKHPYFNEFTYNVDQLDVSRLQSAFQHISDLVQALRTKFIQTDDGYAQIVLRRQQVHWHHDKSVYEDIDSVRVQNRDQWLLRNKTELTSPFEVTITETSRSRSLNIYIHHALYDGISFDMIMNRVSEAYNGRPVECGPTFTDALPYGPLRVVQDADKFWKTHLGGRFSKDLPHLTGDLPAEDPVEISALEGGAGLNDICRQLGVSHQAVMQACFVVALHELAPEADFYGTVVSGRSFAFEHADQVMGPLFNTIPNPLLLQSDDTWSSLIQKCHEFSVAALPYQHTPLRDMKKWCGREPSDPVFQAMFVFQNLQAVGTSSSNIWQPVQGPVKAEYPLAFELEYNSRSELSATVVARRHIATQGTLRKLMTTFNSSLKILCDDPSQHIADHFQVTTTSAKVESVVNGINKSTSHLNGVHDFKWTRQAEKLRSEIAKLASLDENEIDEHSSLFSLGLDSIDAVKLTSRLKKSGMLISVSALIRSQTIPRIISSIESTTMTPTAEPKESRLQQLEQQLPNCVSFAESSDKTQVECIMPATPSQEALISEMVRSDFHEYYNHDVLRLQHDVDLKRLANAWEVVIHNSPILRTSFTEVSSPDIDVVYAQVVHAPEALKITHVELSDVSEVDSILEKIRDEVKVSLSEKPPTRITYVKAASEDYLILSLAHAQYDGHSLALIHEDVQLAYLEQLNGNRPPPDTLIEASLAAVDSEALAFWRNNLSGARICRMPEMNNNANTDTLHRVEATCSITAKEARTFCRSSGFSLQALGQTVWALTLAHYTGRLDVIFGAVLACRDSEEAEKVLFPLMNTIPIRATLHGTRREMAKHMQDVSTDVLPFQRTPLRHIQKVSAANIVRSEATNDSNALFDSLFIFQHRPDSASEQKRTLYESVGGSSNIEYPVAVEIESLDEHMVLRAACKHVVLDHNGAQGLLKTFDHILSAIIHTPNEPTVSFLGSKASICGLPAIHIEMGPANGIPSAQEGQDVSETPTSSIEAGKIRDALCQVSKTPPGELSASSTIESIGIDSISAIKVVALLRKQGVKLSVGELIRAKTVARMAKIVQDRETAPRLENDAQEKDTLVARYVEDHKLAEVSSAHGIQADNVQVILPALPGQTYMLNVWQATKGLLFYPTFSYTFGEHATEDQFRNAWDALVAKHDILRTVFCATSDGEVPISQVVLKQVASTFTSGIEERHAMSRQPMAHLHVVRTSTAWELKLRIHHALYDASSLPLLMDDFESLLAGSSPNPSPVSQNHFLSLSLTTKALASRQEFWKTYLRNVNVVTLQQPGQDCIASRVEIFKPALIPATTSLEATARREGLTLQSLLFAAYAKIYAGFTRQSQHDTTNDDVILGIYLAGRSHFEHLPTLRSPTLNLVPLLVRSASATPLIESARQIQKDLEVINTPENSAVALWEIAAWTDVKVDTFVNFQRLANTTDEPAINGKEPTGKLGLVEDERLAARSHVVNAHGNIDEDFQPASELSSTTEHVKDAYLVSSAISNPGIRRTCLLTQFLQHSVDLEATITPSGTLDVGFFSPEDMVNLQAAENALQALRQELEEL